MTQIASLPTLSVAIGVDATSWTVHTGQTLIDVTAHVKDFRTQSGKQHELDRFETSQIMLTLDNRLGWFTPYDTTAQTYPISGSSSTYSTSPANLVAAANYVRVQATWSGTTYTVFRGFISAAQLNTPDEVNSEVVLTAEDPMKMLSTTRLLNTKLYPNLLTAQNAYLTGPNLILTRCGDQKINLGPLETDAGGFAPSVLGAANAGVAGPFTYDDTTAIDLSNGTNAPAGSIVYPDMNPANNTSTEFYVEAWFKGAKTGDFLLSNYRPSNFQITGIGVDSDGHVRLQRRTLTATVGAPTDVTLDAPRMGPKVDDGAWHLVGLQWRSNTWKIFVDGQTVSSYSDSTARLRILSVGAWITGSTALPVGQYGTNATVANVAYAGLYTFGIDNQLPYVHDRYRVGALLTTNTYQAKATGLTGTGTTATITAGGFVTGQTVTLQGFSATGLDGNYLITAHTATTFSIASTVTSSTTLGTVILPYKTTGYRVLEALQVAGIIPAISGSGNGAPALSKSSGTGLYWSIDTGTAFTGSESGTSYNRAASEVCLQASDTELGAFFWSSSLGSYVFHDRFWWARNVDAPTAFMTDDPDGDFARYLGDVEIVKDDLDLWTDASISLADGTNVTDSTGKDVIVGPRTITRSTDADSTITGKAIASTILYRHGDQRIRASKVTLSSATGSTNVVTILGTMLGDGVIFQRKGVSATRLNQTTAVVEAKAHEFRAEPGEWRCTFTLSPFEAYGTPYMTLDVTTIGSDGYFTAPFGG